MSINNYRTFENQKKPISAEFYLKRSDNITSKTKLLTTTDFQKCLTFDLKGCNADFLGYKFNVKNLVVLIGDGLTRLIFLFIVAASCLFISFQKLKLYQMTNWKCTAR